MQHKMWSITLGGKLHLAPIGPSPENVLDIATGTGIWAINFGALLSFLSYFQRKLNFLSSRYLPLSPCDRN